MSPEPSLDEALLPDGSDRDHAAAALAAVRAYGPRALAADVARAAADLGLRHGPAEESHLFTVDPVPRVLHRAEWARLAAGLTQRLRALEAFVADAHGPREAVRAGVVPAAVLDTNRYLTPGLPTPRRWIGMAGPDVVRGADGELVVLEDNVRTPSLLAYALAARDLVAPLLDVRPGPAPVREAAVAAVRRMLAAATDVPDPVVAVLGDGPRSAVAWEIDRFGEMVDAPVVLPAQLAARGDALVLPDGRRVDLLWRRTSEERLTDDDGRPNELGELLLGPLRAGTVTVVNAFGTGVADDKRTFPYVEDLVRFFLGEEPQLRSVPAYDLGEPAQCRAALERLAELVLKPRSGSGGHGVLIGPRADAAALERARAAVLAAPGEWIAQEPVALSTHPTVVDGALVPRHVDHRPYAFCAGDETVVLPGGFTRVSLTEGELVVNASQGGGGKDTWVVG
ncbi:circularly permuted type 2 ATP-grasp protein [Geodermatophilus sp. DSM 44513]|uniref:circularly permuted type 2 ATP-grasp protein n=1 Tax=Geodermatophilus sp. DSM 44513 TaxID=1528104 RepID=UPI001279CFFE|nr:circularly permuted type 2 ATP-grasp protein [Geodermatophilus sp. DSM 44513]WNV73569.1 circularly permuted type 2 ATP-grasp protein [Geodermatophilus sp. DSM 44513]